MHIPVVEWFYISSASRFKEKKRKEKKRKKKKKDRPTDPSDFRAKRANKAFIFLGPMDILEKNILRTNYLRKTVLIE